MIREPALLIAAIMSLVYVSIEFGVDLTETQTNAVAAALVAIGAWWTRSKVSPVADKPPADE